jgi:hypothetical protein
MIGPLKQVTARPNPALQPIASRYFVQLFVHFFFQCLQRRALSLAAAELCLVRSMRGAVPLARLVHENVSDGRGAQAR